MNGNMGSTMRHYWKRIRDEAQEEYKDSLTESLMDDKWRGASYYQCVSCKSMTKRHNCHILPVHNLHKDGFTLEPICHKCYLYYTDNGEAEIVE